MAQLARLGRNCGLRRLDYWIFHCPHRRTDLSMDRHARLVLCLHANLALPEISRTLLIRFSHCRVTTASHIGRALDKLSGLQLCHIGIHQSLLRDPAYDKGDKTSRRYRINRQQRCCRPARHPARHGQEGRAKQKDQQQCYSKPARSNPRSNHNRAKEFSDATRAE